MNIPKKKYQPLKWLCRFLYVVLFLLAVYVAILICGAMHWGWLQCCLVTVALCIFIWGFLSLFVKYGSKFLSMFEASAPQHMVDDVEPKSYVVPEEDRDLTIEQSMTWGKIKKYMRKTLKIWEFTDNEISQIVKEYKSLVYSKKVKEQYPTPIKKEGRKAQLTQQDITYFTFNITNVYGLEYLLVGTFIKAFWSDWFSNTDVRTIVKKRTSGWGSKVRIRKQEIIPLDNL